MKNLKRVLSLALSGIMLVGMMAVSASAVDAKDFTDASEIQHNDAVSTMVALNVINGKDTGAFDPQGSVTRAEMAKMITVALNGGKDFKFATKSTPTYSDIDGHWAESYIEYCSNLKIIAGQGDGTFAPGSQVTGSAAAKMILVAIGYDAATEGMTGVDWEINTNRLAGQKNLYKDLDINPSEPLNRDDAAQLIYNGTRASMVEYDYRIVTDGASISTQGTAKDRTYFVDGTEYNTTILTDKFDMREAEGLLKGISYVEAAGKEPEKFVYTIAMDKTADGKVTTAADLVGAGADMTFKADPKDYSDLLGEQVNVLYKIENKNQRVIYGVYSTSDTVVTATVGDLEVQDNGKKTIKIDGTSYNLDGKTEEINYYTFANSDFGTEAAGKASKADLGDSTKVAKVSAVKFICNSADGKMDYAIVTPATVGKVTYKGNSSITIGNGVGAYELDDIEIDDSIKKNDWVIFTPANHSVKGIAKAVPATVVTGKVEAMKNTDIRVNGVWYKSDLNAEAPGINKEVTLIVVGSYYYDADATTETSVDDILFVADAVDKDTVGDGKVEAIVAFTDGSTKTVNISEVNGETAAVAENYTDYDTDGKVVEGAMYTYSVAKSGNYELTTLKTGKSTTSSDRAGFEEFAKADAKFDCSDAKKPTVGSYVIADDAVVFVRSDESKKTTVITGKELKDWNLGKDNSGSAITEWGANGQALAEKVKGAMSAKVIALYSDDAAIPGSQGGKAYGLVLSDAVYVKEDGTNYAEITIWNGEEELNTKAEKIYDDEGKSEQTPSSSNVKTLKAALKGAFVEYETLANGNITALKVIGTNAALVSTYTDRDGDTTLGFVDDGDYSDNNTDAALTITNKTVIIYVNTKDTKGVSNGDYELATETAVKGFYIRNVVYASEDNDKLDVMFVDVNSNLKSNSDTKTLTDNTKTALGVQFDQDKHILYLNDKDLAVKDLLSAEDEASKLVYTGLAAEITAKATGDDAKLGDGDMILVVAEDGSSVTYSVKKGAMPKD